MNGGMFGYPGQRRFFLLLGSGTTTRVDTFTPRVSGWYHVSGIGGGAGGNTVGNKGGVAGTSSIRYPLYLRAATRYSISVGGGGAVNGAGSATTLTDPAGTVLFSVAGGTGTTATQVGENGLYGFETYPDTFYPAGGGAAFAAGSYNGSGGGDAAVGAPGAIVIDYPEGVDAEF